MQRGLEAWLAWNLRWRCEKRGRRAADAGTAGGDRKPPEEGNHIPSVLIIVDECVLVRHCELCGGGVVEMGFVPILEMWFRVARSKRRVVVCFWAMCWM